MDIKRTSDLRSTRYPAALCGLAIGWVLCFGGCAAPGEPASAIDRPRTIHLVNGRNLDGLYTYLRDYGRDRDPHGVFSLVDGAIRISGQDWGCLTTTDEYKNYRLIAEYKWGDETFAPRETAARDSGILLHSIGKDGGYDNTWMHAIEIQIIEGGTGDFILVGEGSEEFSLTTRVRTTDGHKPYFYDPAADLMTLTGKGRINWLNHDANWRDAKGFRGRDDAEKPVGQWNRLECIVEGDTITVVLNGLTVNRAQNVRPTRGRIQIQSEGAEIFFRRLDLIALPDC